MKKRTMIAILMSAVMLVSCAKAEPEAEPEDETTATTTVEETTAETTVAETEATTRPTTAATTTAEPTPTTAAVSETKPDPVDEGSLHYDMFMAKVDEIEASASGEYTYAIRSIYNYETRDYYCVLVAFRADEITSYAIFDGEMVVYEEEDLSSDEIDYSHTYDEIKLMPCLFDTRLTSLQLTEEGTDWNAAVGIADSIGDGTYFGGLVALSDDGTRALIEVGEIISFDREMILSMSEGDSIGYGDFVIDEIYINGEYVQVNLASEMYGYEFHLTDHDEADPSKLYLCGDSEAWCMTNMVLVEVPVSPDCVESDTYMYVYDADEIGYNDREITGNPITDSYFWCCLDHRQFGPYNNGWYIAGAVIEPVTIQNGEVTQIHLGFR